MGKNDAMMMHRVFGGLTALTLTLLASAAIACPDVEEDGEDLYYSSDDLWNAVAFAVIAGGDQDLDRCDFNGPFTTGHVAAPPDFELHYRKTRDFDLRFTAVGDCDTVLLINTGAGNWFFDDDDGQYDAQIHLTNPSDGLYDIWIGTYENRNCEATLTIETFPEDS
ncbi:hypothetical protein [Pseudooceanicola algae]|nr:hypothetical protein [Pseudooceanicola algae]